MKVNLALLFLIVPLGCGDDPPGLGTPDLEVCLLNRTGTRYCIETYEAARRDSDAASAGTDSVSAPVSLPARMPWTDITWDSARQACAKKNKRLCERAEWVDACDGAVGEADGVLYTYGDTLDEARCNTGGDTVIAGGSRQTCMASTGTFDQSGNAWEWTGTTLGQAVARGGSFRSTRTHTCLSPEDTAAGEVIQPNGGTSPEVGFRCCRDI